MLKKHSEQNTAKLNKILHCTSWYVKHPIIYRVSFTLLSNGAKFGFKTHVPQHLIHSKQNTLYPSSNNHCPAENGSISKIIDIFWLGQFLHFPDNLSGNDRRKGTDAATMQPNPLLDLHLRVSAACTAKGSNSACETSQGVGLKLLQKMYTCYMTCKYKYEIYAGYKFIQSKLYRFGLV